jgi:PA domain
MKRFLSLICLGLAAQTLFAQYDGFFNIHTPANINNSYLPGQYTTTADWGYLGMPSSPIIGEMVYAGLDSFGLNGFCNPNNLDYTGKIVLIDRGSCEFGMKALNAQTQGAIGVVIRNHNDTMLVNMGAGAVGAQVTIPVIMLPLSLGQTFIDEIIAGNTVVASFANEPVNLGRVDGKLTFDENENCTADTGEIGLGGWQIQSVNGNNTVYAYTKTDGSYRTYVPLGTSVISVNPPANFWTLCTNDFTVNFSQYDSTTVNFEVKAELECPQLTVDIEVPLLRRCFDNYFDIDYCNLGSATAEDAYVTVQFDDLLSIVSASVPYIALGNNSFQFDLDDVAVGQCGHIDVTTYLSCDATWEQTLCAVAEIYPNDPCVLPTSNWSGADIRIRSQCLPDVLNFVIENRGDGDMAGPLNYTLLKDGQYVETESFQLAAGVTMTFGFDPDGSTYRMEADQEPDHPSQTLVAHTSEGCTNNGVFTTGIFNMFPTADYGEAYDEECMPVIGSYDPNDKTGFPLGYGPEHYIERGTNLQYLIRFQNTGTDTAFNIVVRDTITDLLDLTTLRPGSSSHPYELKIEGGNILVFKFNQIMLPDSFVNEPGSHGYLNFSISQKPNLPLGSIINNSAAIYFDFNAPVITNTYFHEIGENFINSATTKVFVPGLEVAIAPNPMSETAIFDLGDAKFQQGSIEVFDASGKLLYKQAFDSPRFELKRNGLPYGGLIFTIKLDGQTVAAGNLVVD